MAQELINRANILGNPGNGTFRLQTYHRARPFSSVSIYTPQPDTPLDGQLEFKLGDDSVVLDLAAGQRYLAWHYNVPFCFVTASDIDPSQTFSLLLV